jgi:hypothetical protein
MPVSRYFTRDREKRDDFNHQATKIPRRVGKNEDGGSRIEDGKRKFRAKAAKLAKPFPQLSFNQLRMHTDEHRLELVRTPSPPLGEEEGMRGFSVLTLNSQQTTFNYFQRTTRLHSSDGKISTWVQAAPAIIPFFHI